MDLITLREELDRCGKLEAAGGSTYLASLVDGVPRVSNVEHYASIVRERALRREIIHATEGLQKAAGDLARPAPEVAREMAHRGAELTRAASLRLCGRADKDGAGLLRGVEQFIGRFMVLPPRACLPIALWTMATHIFDEFSGFPYLAVVGPVKRCGKTRLLSVLELLTRNPRRAAGISEAALFRLVEAETPTLLLDESEFLRGRGERAEALRLLLNAGHDEGAVVYRCVGPKSDVHGFKVFSPKAFACIGSLPETLHDRSITILMQRKRAGETVERFSIRRVGPEGETLRDGISAWAGEHRDEVVEAYDALRIDFLNDDRAVDNFELLFAMLHTADRSRFNELRACAEVLVVGKAAMEVDENLALTLLRDIHAVWPDGQAAMFTVDLLGQLRDIPDGPWAADIELTARKLARWLRGFEVERRTVRIGTATAKGYSRSEIDDAFARYFGDKESHESQTIVDAPLRRVSRDAEEGCVTDVKSQENPLQLRVVTDVTHSEAETGREGADEAGPTKP